MKSQLVSSFDPRKEIVVIYLRKIPVLAPQSSPALACCSAAWSYKYQGERNACGENMWLWTTTTTTQGAGGGIWATEAVRDAGVSGCRPGLVTQGWLAIIGDMESLSQLRVWHADDRSSWRVHWTYMITEQNWHVRAPATCRGKLAMFSAHVLLPT
jgi:hypothetical protein